jgi:hypothetical protein
VDLDEDEFEVVPASQQSKIPESLQWDGKAAKAPRRKRPEPAPEPAAEPSDADVVEPPREVRTGATGVQEAEEVGADKAEVAGAQDFDVKDGELDDFKDGPLDTPKDDPLDVPLFEVGGKFEGRGDDFEMPTIEDINKYWKSHEMHTFSNQEDNDAIDEAEEELEDEAEKEAESEEEERDEGSRFETWGVPRDKEAEKQRPDGHMSDVIDELLSHYRGTVLTTLQIFEQGWDAQNPEEIEAALTELEESQTFIEEFKKMHKHLSEAVGYAKDTKTQFYFTTLLHKKDELAEELDKAIQVIELDLARSAEKFGHQKQTAAYLDLQVPCVLFLRCRVLTHLSFLSPN